MNRLHAIKQPRDNSTFFGNPGILIRQVDVTALENRKCTPQWITHRRDIPGDRAITKRDHPFRPIPHSLDEFQMIFIGYGTLNEYCRDVIGIFLNIREWRVNKISKSGQFD
jgi:hypothetical protein